MLLSAIEARIIGCLLEKEVTTPDQYPLSLNALTLACNQKTSRDPVMDLSESDVQAGLDSLAKKRLVSDQSGFGSRVVKYKHRFCNTEFSDLQLSKAETAVVALLLLRGPQTPGELRTRAGRQHEFKDIQEVERTLAALAGRETPLVSQLAREPGKRESRFALLILEESEAIVASAGSAPFSVASSSQTASTDNDERIAALEARIAALEARLDALEN
jgi:uncharacterized protein YceH (UPF0502 family)